MTNHLAELSVSLIKLQRWNPLMDFKSEAPETCYTNPYLSLLNKSKRVHGFTYIRDLYGYEELH